MAASVVNLRSTAEPERRIDISKLDFSNCPVRDVMQQINGKWSTLLIECLSQRPFRFGELKRMVPDISQRMLTQTLRDLQRDGYVAAIVFAAILGLVRGGLDGVGRGLMIW